VPSWPVIHGLPVGRWPVVLYCKFYLGIIKCRVSVRPAKRVIFVSFIILDKSGRNSELIFIPSSAGSKCRFNRNTLGKYNYTMLLPVFGEYYSFIKVYFFLVGACVRIFER
jgi:hypothetical protein